MLLLLLWRRGLQKEQQRFWARPWRWAKTVFFVLAMLASLLLVCAPPLLVVVLDLLLPTSFLSSYFRRNPQSAATSHLRDFRFRSSLVDVPVVSAARSLVVLCAYVACRGRGAYLGITTLCSFVSACYVLAKSVVTFGVDSGEWARRGRRDFGESGGAAAAGALFVSSVALAAAHVAVAYRTSCRERRKLLVYRIDIEAVKLKGIQTKGVK